MKIAIVGGGFTGLTAAYYLSQKGHKVVIYEKEKYLGGLSSCFRYENYYLEKYVHHFFTGDNEVVNLINKLGLKNKIKWWQSKNAIFYQNKILSFTSFFNLLKFPALNIIQKIRFGIFYLYLKLQNNYHHFKSISAEKWLKKYMGKKVWQIIWKPLLTKKFGNKYYKKISMAWMWARIFCRSFSLGYPLGGLELVIQKMHKIIIRNGGKVFTGSEIQDLKQLKKFDKIIVTTSPQIFLNIAKNKLPKKYIKKLKRINYFAVVSLVLFLKKNLLKDIYWLNINDYTIPFVVCVEHTNFVKSESYGSNHIVYLESYIAQNDRNLEIPENKIFNSWLPFLQKINPAFKIDWVKTYKVFKDQYAQPIVDLDYHDNIPQVHTPLKNVFFVSMCQVYPQDRQVNFAIKSGREVAIQINRS